jgi:hypothetical protein
MKKFLIALTLVFCVSASDAEAKISGYTGNDLFSYCTGDNEFLKALCTGLIIGSKDHILMTRDYAPWYRNICVDDEVGTNQTVDVVMNYLRNYPQNRHAPYFVIMKDALIQAFPCN